MTQLEDLVDLDKLNALIADKRIAVQVHPALPLRIYNYTNRAQFANEWTEEERVCRGLIVDENDKVIARGPSKFFNYGQTGAPEVALTDKVWVSKKEDGSLGIAYAYGDHVGIATRGSFTSEQATRASSLLDNAEKIRIRHNQRNRNQTQIYEIVYPGNRIVLDYKGLEKNIKLGFVNNDTGLIEGRNLGVLYSKDGEMFGFGHEMTFADALALPIPDDEEGYVLDIRSFDKPGEIRGHLKLKGDRYKELHGAIFGLSERKIWEAMVDPNESMDEFVSALPDELIGWAEGVIKRISSDKDWLYIRIATAFTDTIIHFDKPLGEVPRGDIARRWKELYPDLTGPLFSMLDSRHDTMFEWVHKQVRPEHKLFRVEDETAN
jgi:RNA ligase